ncbi:MAG: hypothetical protein E7Z76_00810 [Methanobrevibacter sp.]|nr:hypothetical protein [Methanobrevibacter sp.]
MKDDSLFSKFLYRYIFISDPGSLSNKERIGMFSVPIIFTSIAVLWIYIMSNDWEVWLLWCGLFIFYFGLFYPLLFYEKINEQYGVYSTIRFGSTYQYISRTLAYITPGLIVIILSIGYILENLSLASLIAFAFVLPFLALFFRIDVFNDNSSIDGDEFILGYRPDYYGLASLFIGLYGYYNVYKTLNSNLELSVLFFVMTVIFQILFLFPDKCNEVLFFDLRRKEGCIAFSIILIVLYFAISYLLNGEFIISLSLQSFIRIIFLLGIGTIFAILFKRQIKQMDNKK